MGTTSVMYYFKHDDRKAVADVLRRLGVSSGYVSDASNGWVAVVDADCDELATNKVAATIRAASRDLQTSALFLIVWDSDLCGYLVMREGREVDRYATDPTALEWAKSQSRGVPQKLSYLLDSKAVQQLEKELRRDLAPCMAGVKRLFQIADCFGIDRRHTLQTCGVIESRKAMLQRKLPAAHLKVAGYAENFHPLTAS